MKKYFIACLALLILCPALGACAGGQPPALGFDPALVDSAAVYTGGVPAAAMKKEVEDARQIASLLQLLEQVQLGREATAADVAAGGIGLQFEFRLQDGTRALVHLGADGATLRTPSGFRVVTACPAALRDEDAFFAALSGEAQPVPEAELPEF
ncbi:Uncharacterised protein [uncultured Clostridium sp.]|nr:Uncharacterised protein [uncultured Clostridium sp.]